VIKTELIRSMPRKDAVTLWPINFFENVLHNKLSLQWRNAYVRSAQLRKLAGPNWST